MLLDLCEMIELARKAAQEAGRAVVAHWSAYKLDVRSKGATDVVSAADHVSHRIISAAIGTAFPDHRIISEEDTIALEVDYSGPSTAHVGPEQTAFVGLSKPDTVAFETRMQNAMRLAHINLVARNAEALAAF